MMNLFSLTKNTVALLCVAGIAIGFFVAGLFNVLDYFIIKALLFSCFGILLGIAISYAITNENKKKRPEDTLKDDYN